MSGNFSGYTKFYPVNPFVAKPHISQYFVESPIHMVIGLLYVRLAKLFRYSLSHSRIHRLVRQKGCIHYLSTLLECHLMFINQSPHNCLQSLNDKFGYDFVDPIN